MLSTILKWAFSKFGAYGLLVALVLYALNAGYEHYTNLGTTITTLTEERDAQAKTIKARDTSIAQLSHSNAELDKSLKDLEQKHTQINKASADLQTKNHALQVSLQTKEQQLKDKVSANEDNNVCVNSPMPDYINQLLDDARAEAARSAVYNSKGSRDGQSAGRLDSAMPGTDQTGAELERRQPAEFTAVHVDKPMPEPAAENTTVLW